MVVDEMAHRSDDDPRDTSFKDRITMRDVYDRISGTEAVVRDLQKTSKENSKRIGQLESSLQVFTQEFSIRREHDQKQSDTQDLTASSHSARLDKLERAMPPKHMDTHTKLGQQVTNMPTWANLALVITTIAVIATLILQVARVS